MSSVLKCSSKLIRVQGELKIRMFVRSLSFWVVRDSVTGENVLDTD